MSWCILIVRLPESVSEFEAEEKRWAEKSTQKPEKCTGSS